MKRIYLIDCPGVVPPSTTDTPQDILLRGVVRVENVENPEQYIPAVLKKTKPQHIERTYDLKGYKDHIEFLELLARKGGRLLRGGEPDVDGVAKMVLNDFLRGKIPWFTPPPLLEGSEAKDEKGINGRDGRLGEMGKKRKRDDATSVADTSVADLAETDAEDDDEFQGFESEGGVALEDEDDDDSDDGMPDSDSEVDEGDSESVDAGGDDDEAAEEQLLDEFRDKADIDAEAKGVVKPDKKRRKV